MRTEKNSVIDNFLTLAIFLVLVQTLLEDVAVIAGWSVQARRYLLYAGFAFDLLFSVEFLARFFTALSLRDGLGYLFRRRGWVDFLAALPLLLLDSGPRMYALAAGGGLLLGGVGTLNVLKSVKAIRLARILRFLRALKLFRNIKYADSPMAQRHLARIATLAVSSVVFAALCWGLLASALDLPAPVSELERAQNEALTGAISSPLPGTRIEEQLSAARGDLLMVREGDTLLYSRYGNDYYASYFDAEDYRVEKRGGMSFFFDLRSARAVQSREQITIFLVVIALLVSILFLYGPHFAVSVSDPVHVMKRGFSEDDYNLEVRIDPKFEGDDVYRLAALYNRKYLALKARELFDSGEGVSSLTMADLGVDFDPDEA